MAVSNPSPALLAAAVQPLQPAEMPQRACRWQACAVPLACVALLALAGPWWSDYLSGLVVKTMILAIFAPTSSTFFTFFRAKYPAAVSSRKMKAGQAALIS